jgi:hypothetical protein
MKNKNQFHSQDLHKGPITDLTGQVNSLYTKKKNKIHCTLVCSSMPNEHAEVVFSGVCSTTLGCRKDKNQKKKKQITCTSNDI